MLKGLILFYVHWKKDNFSVKNNFYTCTTPIVIFIKHKLTFIIYKKEKKYFFPMETVNNLGSSAYNIFWRVTGSHKAKLKKNIEKKIGVVGKICTVIMFIEMGEFHWHLYLKNNFMSLDFSSVALDPKHFTSISILKDPLYFVWVKSFQDIVW